MDTKILSVHSHITGVSVEIRIQESDGRRKANCHIFRDATTLWNVSLEVPPDMRTSGPFDEFEVDPLLEERIEASYQRKLVDANRLSAGWLWIIGPQRFELQLRAFTGVIVGSLLVALSAGGPGSRDPLFIEANGAWGFSEG